MFSGKMNEAAHTVWFTFDKYKQKVMHVTSLKCKARTFLETTDKQMDK